MSKRVYSDLLINAREEKAKREAELMIAKNEKAERDAELIIANKEKANREAELAIANAGKAKRAAELIIANTEKAKHAAELVIANAEKAKSAAVLLIANIEKEKHADKLINADNELTYQQEEKLKLAAELVIADINKTRREAELVIANIEKAKRIAELAKANKELVYQKNEKAKRASEFVIAEALKSKREADLVIENIKKAKRAAELVIANIEKAKHSAELVIANKELVYQKSEKTKRATELLIANVEKAKRSAELVIANIEKAKSAAQFIAMNKELMLAKEKEKLVTELIIVNKELTHQIERRKQSDQKLKENNEKYSEAFKSSPNSISIARIKDGKFIEVNDAFTTIFGFSRKEATTSSLIGLGIWVNIEDRKWVISTLLDDKPVSGKEYLFRKKNGEIMTGLYAARFILINNEYCIISSIEDITEQKKAYGSMRESKLKAEQYLNVAAEIIISLDLQGNITLLNESGHKLLGYNSGELIGINWFETFLLEEDVPKVSELFNKTIYGEIDNIENYENKIKTKSGTVRSILWHNSLLKDTNGKFTGVLSSGEDITKRKQVEKALLESNEKFQSYIEHSPVGIFVVDKTGKYYDCNPAAYEMVGYTREELLSINIIDLLPVQEIEKGLQNFQKLLEDGFSKFEINLRRKDKSTVCVLLEAVQLPENNMFMAFKTDIEKIKKAEIELRKKFDEIESINKKLGDSNAELIKAKEKAEESERLKSAFLTNMSHEIRTPMNGILGFAELLMKPDLTSDELQAYIQNIQISGARMLNTINSIVDMSKIESGLMKVNMNETNINERTELVHKFFKYEVEKKGLRFVFKNGLPLNESIIKTDNEKVYAILTNLVRNAIKFTYEGSIELGYEKKGEYLEFFVKDTGVGIPKKQHQMIFERFRQGSESLNRGFEGSGLGLSICKSYVEMLGGRIWLESDEGFGSVFYFTIPYHPVFEEKTIVKDSEEYKEVYVKKLKILIVEDDEMSYSLLTRVLQKISKEVLHAITGVEAVDACRNNPDLDLVLMDIRMPQMSGLEATQQIRQFNKDLIIIAQTAYAFSDDNEKAIEAGCNDYISKPINKYLLYELIKKNCKI